MVRLNVGRDRRLTDASRSLRQGRRGAPYAIQTSMQKCDGLPKAHYCEAAPFVLTVSRLARDTVASLNQSPYTRLILHLGLGCRTRDEVHIITRTQLFSELKSIAEATIVSPGRPASGTPW